jgi:hypothetical protein
MSSFMAWLAGVSGISAVGWILVGLIYVPATVVVLAVARGPWKRRPWLKLALFAVVYLPLLAGIAEAVYVDRRFKALCETAGLKVRRVVVTDGFFYDSRGADMDNTLKEGQNGFRYVEWIDHEGRYWRSEVAEPGVVRRTRIDQPSAQYAYRFVHFSSPHGHLMKRREDFVLDRSNGEVTASHVIGYRFPAFIDRLWSQYLGAGPHMCGLEGSILLEALIGIDKKGR